MSSATIKDYVEAALVEVSEVDECCSWLDALPGLTSALANAAKDVAEWEDACMDLPRANRAVQRKLAEANTVALQKLQAHMKGASDAP